MKIGIMLMSNRDPDGQPMDWRKHLEECKQHGLEAVDVFDRMLQAVGETVPGIQKTLSDLGLAPSLYCVPTDLVSPDPEARKESLDTIKRGIDACHELGLDNLFSHGGQHNNEGEEALARYVDGLQQAADLCAAEGITLSIENAGKMCHTDTELKRCIEMVDRPNMKITFDGGNFILAGCDSHRAAKLLADKVVHVHVKSFVSAPENKSR
ncbi:MAG: sugar phosphate isomerase/epimerase, partial [Planctomycetes bacterium]|nr:sugar phosphate isomerase/epimerase [Planctomycetota bacterium]